MKVSATTRNADPEKAAWDTDFWGFNVGKATHLHGLSEWAIANTMGLICLLVDTVAEVREAEERGFRLTDVRVTLAREIRMGVLATVSEATEEDVPLLRDIASSAFKLTRFYSDPRLDDGRCGDLYSEWTRASCEGLADVVLVARRKGEPVGYVTVNAGFTGSEIVLIAVREDFRGHGIGRELVDGALSHAFQCGSGSMEVVTQATNVAALQTFTGRGFKIDRTQFWLHKWYDT